MLSLASSITKPTSLAKQRSVVFDGAADCWAATTAVDAGLKPPITAAGTDRSHTYAFWVKFTNTDAVQGVFASQINTQDGVSIYLDGSKVKYQENYNGVQILNHEGDTVLTDAIKQDWMLWVFTHSRPADNSTGVQNIYINGTTATYGSTANTYSGSIVLDNGANGGSYIGGSIKDATGSWGMINCNGMIAQVGFWHRVLSAADIKAMYVDPKMDWRYNSGNYTNTGIQRYYKPFSNQLDDSINFKFRDLIQWVPPVYTVCDDEAIGSWTSGIGGNSITDLGSGERRFDIAGSTFAGYCVLSGAGILDADVATGTELTITCKAKIVTTSTTTATLGLFGGASPSNVIPANQDYIDVTLVHETVGSGDLIVFLMSGTNSGDDLFFKDFVIKKRVDAPGEFVVDQTDQISNDAPGN